MPASFIPLLHKTAWFPFTLAAVCQTADAQPFPAPPTPPNIVIILADDMGYNDIGSYTFGDGTNPAPYDPSSYAPLPGPNQAAGLTPRIDSLATDGLKFTNYYASAAQCSPARAALLTGTYPYRNGIPEVLVPDFTNSSRARGLHENERTLPELLKERGYATTAVGKWHLGDTPQFLPTRHGFDSWFGIPYSNDMWPPNSSRGNWPTLYLHEDDGTVNYTTQTGGQITGSIDGDTEQSYLLEAMTEKALAFIDAEKDRPFFLYFSPHAVHVPCFPHPDFRGDTVSWYYDQVKELDHRVGQIMDRLETHGLTNNTIVIFSSDNGPWLNRNNPSDAEQAVGSAYPLWGRKSTVWEGGPRVPFLVKWPTNIPAGEVRDQLAQHIDLLPTLVKLAGGEIPTEPMIDGGDLWPVLAENAPSPSDEFYYFMSTTLYAVRKGDWKYYSNSGSGADAGTLVNLDTDIQEQSNVSGANGATVSQLSGLRNSFWNEINSNSRPAGSHSSQGIRVESAEISVPEGGSANFRIQLLQNPGSALTLSIARQSGDPDLTSAATVVIDSSNWNSWSDLAVSAGEDGDTLDSGSTFRISGSGMPFREVVAVEQDNDTVPGIEPALVWPKVTYATLQDANHGLIADGTATINSIPEPSGTTYAWSQVSGDAVVFENAAAKETGVTFPAVGDYVLRLTAGYPGADSLSTDFQVRVDPVGATPPGGGGAVETERVPYAMETPGVGSFGSGFTNYRAIVNWYERYSPADNADTNNTANGREGLQDEANSSVPAAAEGAYWIILAPDSSYANPAVYQSLGTWNTGDDTSYEVSFDLGDRDNNTFSSLIVQLIYTDAGFTPNDGTSLTAAPGYNVADSTATYTDASFSGSGNRVLTGLTDTLDVTGIADGQEVWIRVTASGNGTQSLIDNLSATSEEATTVNIAPVIDPGSAQSTAYSVNSITLAGSVSDDGLPSGSSVTTEWTQSGGSGTASITTPASTSSTVSFDYPGDYTLRLIADDGEIKAFRETTGTLDPQTLAEWATAESIPGGQQGTGDNPDGDPWVNLFEFAFGLDPNNADSGARPWDYSIDGSPVGQTISFNVPRDRMPAITLEQSSDLSTGWNPSGLVPTITPVDSEWNLWTFEVPGEVGRDQFFIRLELAE